MVPRYISPDAFWNLSFTELGDVAQNIKQTKWDEDFARLKAGRVLASDISRVLSGKEFQQIVTYMSPNPRNERVKTDDEIERMLLMWAKE